MKRQFTLITLILFAIIATPVQGQGFLKKLNKGLEKINKGLDDASKEINRTLGSDKSVEYSNGEGYGAYNNVKVTSFSKDVNIRLESCIRDGQKVTITYTIVNNGDKMDIISLGSGKTVINTEYETAIYGDDGNTYKLKYFSLGSTNSNGQNRVTLPSGIKLTGKLEIANVKSNVKNLSQVDIAGLIVASDDRQEFIPFAFTFKNVPIHTLDQTLQMLNPNVLLEVDQPTIGTIMTKGMSIKKITFTDKYTRIDCNWLNTEYSPRGTIFVEEETRLEANGNPYALLLYSGLGSYRGDIWINHNDSHDFTYIFEAIPVETKSFNLFGSSLVFGNIYPVKPESFIVIPHTTGVMSSLNEVYNAYHKRTRMTAAVRTKYKIDRITHEFLPNKPANANLSAGKTLYNGELGRLETFLCIQPDHMTSEFLVSYDTSGNYIDCVYIGEIREYSGDRAYAEIEDNKIIVHSTYPAYDDEEQLDSITEYEILPTLRFSKTREYSIPL